jgi:hypothetical protein
MLSSLIDEELKHSAEERGSGGGVFNSKKGQSSPLQRRGFGSLFNRWRCDHIATTDMFAPMSGSQRGGGDHEDLPTYDALLHRRSQSAPVSMRMHYKNDDQQQDPQQSSPPAASAKARSSSAPSSPKAIHHQQHNPSPWSSTTADWYTPGGGAIGDHFHRMTEASGETSIGGYQAMLASAVAPARDSAKQHKNRMTSVYVIGCLFGRKIRNK